VAANAYTVGLANGSSAALDYFRAHRKGNFGGRNEAKLIQRWGQRFVKTGTVLDANERRTGRKPKVPEAAVAECAKALLAGYKVDGADGVQVRRGFTSVKAAVDSEKAPTIKKVINKYDITVPSLHRRMRQLVPSLARSKRRVDIKSVLDPAVKKKRKLAASKLRRLPMKQLNAVVWMDAKKLHISGPGKLSVYTDDPDEVVEDARQPQGKFNSGNVLHYYAAVNAILGVVTFIWVTGTTGLHTGYTTTVRLQHLRIVESALPLRIKVSMHAILLTSPLSSPSYIAYYALKLMADVTMGGVLCMLAIGPLCIACTVAQHYKCM
jgi:hypothetical protein